VKQLSTFANGHGSGSIVENFKNVVNCHGSPRTHDS
jgi:hypothetical protein